MPCQSDIPKLQLKKENSSWKCKVNSVLTLPRPGFFNSTQSSGWKGRTSKHVPNKSWTLYTFDIKLFVMVTKPKIFYLPHFRLLWWFNFWWLPQNDKNCYEPYQFINISVYNILSIALNISPEKRWQKHVIRKKKKGNIKFNKSFFRYIQNEIS